MSLADFPAVTSELGFVVFHGTLSHLVHEQNFDCFVANDRHLKYYILKNLESQLLTCVGRECTKNVTCQKSDSIEVEEPITASETWSINAEYPFPLQMSGV